MYAYAFVEYRNKEKCDECGGKCCKIYNADGEEGTRTSSINFEEWVDHFHPDRATYGVEPLFDPLVIHTPGHEKEYAELLANGIDPKRCEYSGPNGCLIHWDRRPMHCKMWKCERFDANDLFRVIPLCEECDE